MNAHVPGTLLAALFDHVKWREVFVPQTPLLEIFVRGTIVYLTMLLLLRLFSKREVGSMGITDLIVIVFVADAAQNAMADNYSAVPDGLLLMLVIVAWAFVLDRLAYRVPLIDRLMRAPPVMLIRDGQLDRRNMRREAITEEELRSELRLQGVADPAEVREARVEQDGRISVVTKGAAGGSRARKKRAA